MINESIKESAEEKPHILDKNFKFEKEPTFLAVKREDKRESVHHREVKEKNKKSRKFYLITSLAVIFLILVGFVGANALPRADIKITLKTADWQWGGSVGLNPNIAEPDGTNIQIPVANFSQTKNGTFSWPATGGIRHVENKATGQITIYDNYSNADQVLVAGTRFETPDGKIFRLQNRITVPGMSSITASVTADQPGNAYNIGQVQKFTVPGFSGSAKFEKIYGQSTQPMAGGFVGDGKYPSDSDIAKAKANAENQIKNGLESYVYSQIPTDGGFKVIDGSKNFKITKETVNNNTDASGNFSVFIEAQESLQAFKESDLTKLMTGLMRVANNNDPDYQIKNYKIDYGSFSADSKNSSISINFDGTFYKPIDPADLKKQILGKSETDLRNLIYSLSSKIEKADISIGPFWVTKVPTDQNKVNLEID